MGKGRAEPGTPKYIANKIKSKGLQKLRWFCQMCNKQCRDENGFKCHTMSESHQRQLLLFADNAGRYLSEFSYEFSKGFLFLLKRQFGTKRVKANKVYQEYISDRNHLHMNATQWTTLTGFVKWLGKTGKCVVDDTDEGWYITYVDRDPATIELEEKMRKKEKAEKDEKEREMEFLQRQIRDGKKKESAEKTTEDNDILKEFVREEDSKLSLNLKMDIFKKPTVAPIKNVLSTASSDRMSITSKSSSRRSEKRKLSALEEIIQEETKKKNYMRKDYWLLENIVVKVTTKTLGQEYTGKKGIVIKVMDKYGCMVKLFEPKIKLKLDQNHVETVIPNIGGRVLVVNGVHVGQEAELIKLDQDNFCVDVKLKSGPATGKIITHLSFEDVCKKHITDS
ncbi:Zinc finger C2H2-type,DNA/RNA-binding protein Kin17, conserved domain [Cinara cedri]|uniref:Zinc finger C2H2-type,DNA/RNA-binding protein Kin17, conserved domain n=1 Tax=Cinara cedri TaxID=506608 RepID=A0A5E4N7F6_9HEMI|nr:Zinc finger C2H2-type,DNA/RNA-binding protein Kin17, conserved domain [Cinara cedri]